MSLGNTANVGRSTYGFYTNATSLYMTASGAIGNITWSGGSTGNWDTNTNNTPWVNNVGGTALQNQTVKTAATASLAIGRAVPEPNAIAVARTSVVVRIKSTLLEAGVLNQVTGSSSGVV